LKCIECEYYQGMGKICKNKRHYPVRGEVYCYDFKSKFESTVAVRQLEGGEENAG